MNRVPVQSVLVAMAATLVFNPAVPSGQSAPYSVRTLPSLARAWVINDRTDVLGDSEDSRISGSVLWHDGTVTVLPFRAADINDLGQIVGYDPANGRVVSWQNGELTDLGLLGTVHALNNRGDLVGENGGRAFVWRNGTVTDLGTLTGANCCSAATAINDAGQVVGWSQTTSSEAHAVRWSTSGVMDLGTLREGDCCSRATAISNRGQVVGYSYSPPDEHGRWTRHAFMWENGARMDLGALAGGDVVGPPMSGMGSAASDINDRGQIVGYSTDRSATYHAVLWQNGSLTDLGPAPGDITALAYSINSRGDIAGEGATTGLLWSGR
jgi:probable HAF family extracellular repeat protein